MDYTDIDQYWIWLSSVEHIGPKRFYQLLSIYEDARSVWDALGAGGSPSEMKFLGYQALQSLRAARNEGFFYRLLDRLDRQEVRAITRLSDAYPAQLTTIYDPPPTLYVRGAASLDSERMFAIVGSRRSTRDGQRAAREIAEGLAGAGVTVVSGMARGIDTYAHEGALAADGCTIAVLGCGVDVCYPPENEGLMQRIIESGGAVVSEYPLGTKPLAGNFPPRNRIISGLSAGTVLVEGAQKSGAMITVNCALDQGRDVFAVPGSIYSPLSAAPNRMIVDGATPVISPWEILEYYRWGKSPEVSAANPHREIELDADEAALVNPMREQELSFEELTQITGFSPSKLNSHLTMLELRGIIVKVPGGMYRAYL